MLQNNVGSYPLELRSGRDEMQNQNQKRARIIFLAVISVLIAACTTTRAQTDQVPSVWGEPVDGLQIAIYFDPNKTQNPRPDDVMLALKNVGTTEIRVTLGGGCGEYSPTAAVVLRLTDSQGKSQELHDNSGTPYCAGALSIFSVPLASGAVYSIPLNLQKYFVRFYSGPLPLGVYSAQAELDWAHIPPVAPPSDGLASHVKSNELRVEFRN